MTLSHDLTTHTKRDFLERQTKEEKEPRTFLETSQRRYILYDVFDPIAKNDPIDSWLEIWMYDTI